MKKLLAILLIVGVLLGLCACGKTKKADKAILAIGEVTLDSEEAISTAVS